MATAAGRRRPMMALAIAHGRRFACASPRIGWSRGLFVLVYGDAGPSGLGVAAGQRWSHVHGRWRRAMRPRPMMAVGWRTTAARVAAGRRRPRRQRADARAHFDAPRAAPASSFDRLELSDVIAVDGR